MFVLFVQLARESCENVFEVVPTKVAQAVDIFFHSSCVCSDVVRCLAGLELNVSSHLALAIACVSRVGV